jgi:hypothetical protein
LRIRSCSRRSTRITWNNFKNIFDDYNIDLRDRFCDCQKCLRRL